MQAMYKWDMQPLQGTQQSIRSNKSISCHQPITDATFNSLLKILLHSSTLVQLAVGHIFAGWALVLIATPILIVFDWWGAGPLSALLFPFWKGSGSYIVQIGLHEAMYVYLIYNLNYRSSIIRLLLKQESLQIRSSKENIITRCIKPRITDPSKSQQPQIRSKCPFIMI